MTLMALTLAVLPGFVIAALLCHCNPDLSLRPCYVIATRICHCGLVTSLRPYYVIAARICHCGIVTSLQPYYVIAARICHCGEGRNPCDFQIPGPYQLPERYNKIQVNDLSAIF